MWLDLRALLLLRLIPTRLLRTVLPLLLLLWHLLLLLRLRYLPHFRPVLPGLWIALRLLRRLLLLRRHRALPVLRVPLPRILLPCLRRTLLREGLLRARSLLALPLRLLLRGLSLLPGWFLPGLFRSLLPTLILSAPSLPLSALGPLRFILLLVRLITLSLMLCRKGRRHSQQQTSRDHARYAGIFHGFITHAYSSAR